MSEVYQLFKNSVAPKNILQKMILLRKLKQIQWILFQPYLQKIVSSKKTRKQIEKAEKWLWCMTTCSCRHIMGCSHMMSAKNLAFADALPSLIRQNKKLAYPSLHPLS